MVTRNEIYEVADRMVADRQPVSVRAVRQGLANRGSPNDITPMLAEWRRERNYQPALAALELSDDLAKALAGVVTAVRAAVAQEVQARAAQETTTDQPDGRALANQIGAFTDVVEHMVARVDTVACMFEEAAAVLDTLPDALRNHPEPPGPAADAPRRFQHGEGRQGGVVQSTALAFWDAVMRKIHEVLRQGPMTPTEIVGALDPIIGAFASYLGHDLTPGLIAQKMRVRVEHGRYFEEREDGRFERRRTRRARGGHKAA